MQAYIQANRAAPRELRDAPNVTVAVKQDFPSGIFSEETFLRLEGGISGIAATHTSYITRSRELSNRYLNRLQHSRCRGSGRSSRNLGRQDTL